MRLAVVSPFLDRQHGTELCVTEQIERLVRQYHWSVELYSQRVSQLNGVRPAFGAFQNSTDSILWHKVSDVPGPHLVKYIWWFFANHWQRWSDRSSGRVRPDLVYSPGINCLDADVIVVHIVFHAFYERVRPELALNRVPLQSWPRMIHRKLYYKLAMLLERKVYRNPRVRLVAVSSLVAAQLKTHFQRNDVAIIPNAVDTVRFTAEERVAKRNESRRSLSYSENDFVALLIGNDWKKKGLDTLLMALASLTDLPLRVLVVGRDDPNFYRPLIIQLALQNRVRFEKPSADVFSFYAVADLYVGPSLEDVFNLPMLEAIACGFPSLLAFRLARARIFATTRRACSCVTRGIPTNLFGLSAGCLTMQTCAEESVRLLQRYVRNNCSWTRTWQDERIS